MILSVALGVGAGEEAKPVEGVLETIQFMPAGNRPWFVKITLEKSKDVYNISSAKIKLDGKKITTTEFVKWLTENEQPKVKIYFDGYLGSIDRIEVTSFPKPKAGPDEREKK
jgi:hypothetical protein